MSRVVTAPARVGLVGAMLFAALIVGGCDARSLTDPLGQTCCTHGPTGAPGGLSRDAAIARALEVAPVSSALPAVIWAEVESDPFVPRGNATPGPLVWIVRLQGALTPSACPTGFLDVPPAATSSACLDMDGGLDVVLDYFTGELLGWVH